MSNETLIMALFGLLLSAYGFIFYSVIGRVKELEDANCNPSQCYKRFEKIEIKQDALDPVFMEIKERLVRIEVLIEELKKK